MANAIENRTEQLAAEIAGNMPELLKNRPDITSETDYAATPLRIYDVDYEKRAGAYSLNVYIDREGGVNIGDCEAFSRLLSDALDEADFIADAYTLVVSSPGLGRKLTKERHFLYCLGEEAEIRTYKADAAGNKEFTGILKSFDNGVVMIQTKDGELSFEKKDIAVCRLTIDF